MCVTESLCFASETSTALSPILQLKERKSKLKKIHHLLCMLSWETICDYLI